MKCLEGKSSILMNKIFGDMSLEENSHKKWDNGGKHFMALVAEVIMPLEHCGKGRTLHLVSLAHYHKQNGDPMRDPEVIFQRTHNPMATGDNFWPISFYQDGIGPVGHREYVTYQQSDQSWKIQVNTRGQNDLCVFVNDWLKNVDDQQGITEAWDKEHADG